MLNGKKIVALIQARCTSTRLPKKHFRYIGDKMLIDWVVDRLKNIKEIDEIVISTTNDISDIPLKEYAEKKGIGFYGYDGDVNDVVGRHYNAVKNSNADYIVVISGDCPLIDKKLILQQFNILQQDFDYVRPNQRCVHEGIDSYSMNCIKFLNENSKTLYERENFGVIIRENLNLVKVGFIDIENEYTENIFRISVDNMADLRFMNELYNKLKDENRTFNLDNVLDLVEKDRDLLEINSHVEKKKKGERTYRFLIKTEASKEKGLGHIKRMMVLGQYLNENKNNGVFYAINKDEIAESILEEKGYIYDYNYAEKEEELIQLINEYKADILIVDVQKLEGNTDYNFENIRKQTGIKKIILIDKYIESDFVDLMIFQGIQSDEFEEKVKGNNKVLYGLDCVFISEDFIKAKKIREKRKKNTEEKEVVISFGGSDPNNLTVDTVKKINNISLDFKAKFKIVLGPYYKSYDALYEELRNFRYKYEIIKNPPNYANELIRCDYGIIAYGVSFYEFLYMGIPTINLDININDKKIINKINAELFDIDYKNLNDINKLKHINIKKCNLKLNLDKLYEQIVDFVCKDK